jgi:hypothetical protein
MKKRRQQEFGIRAGSSTQNKDDGSWAKWLLRR